MFHRKGKLYLAEFDRRLVNSDQYFKKLVLYIHNNPVHHRFA